MSNCLLRYCISQNFKHCHLHQSIEIIAINRLTVNDITKAFVDIAFPDTVIYSTQCLLFFKEVREVRGHMLKADILTSLRKCGRKWNANVMYSKPWHRVIQFTYRGYIIFFLKAFWFKSDLRHEAETGVYTQGLTFSHVRSKDQTFFTCPVVFGPVDGLPL